MAEAVMAGPQPPRPDHEVSVRQGRHPWGLCGPWTVMREPGEGCLGSPGVLSETKRKRAASAPGRTGWGLAAGWGCSGVLLCSTCGVDWVNLENRQGWPHQGTDSLKRANIGPPPQARGRFTSGGGVQGGGANLLPCESMKTSGSINLNVLLTEIDASLPVILSGTPLHCASVGWDSLNMLSGPLRQHGRGTLRWNRRPPDSSRPTKAHSSPSPCPSSSELPLKPWAGPDPSPTTGFPLAAAHLGSGPLRPSEGSNSPGLLRAKRLSCGHSLL